ncbi:MAG TPA: 3-deoxy-manno-octulosonate-8-phosphatase KdsC [Steroidobacteraceae bacterium]|nr:3-deoxy-manno-octulosonate-8-phosphatase KdsC [Steroidobacteraceae bacterium]
MSRARRADARAHSARARKPTAAAGVRLLVLDVDGVLTDGRLYFGPRGELLKAFHVRDGHGIRALRAAGIEVAVITGRRSKALEHRCRELGIRHLIQGADDKRAAFDRLRRRLNVAPHACACIGDDVPDLPLMRAVGRAYAVADAHPLARRAAHRSTSIAGGVGAVREVCDELLAARAARRRTP